MSRFIPSLTPARFLWRTIMAAWGSRRQMGLTSPNTAPGVAGAPLSGFGTVDYAVAINGFDAGVDAGAQALGGSLLDPQGNVPFSLVYWFKAKSGRISYARFQSDHWPWR